MSREIKFRIWWIPRNRFVNECDDVVCIDVDGQVYRMYESIYNEEHDNPKNYAVQQFTGLKDKNGKEIYEGDIVKFSYQAGDFAISDMTEEEYKFEKSIQKEYVGKIVPNTIAPINMEIIVGDEDSTHMIFPLSYAARGIIIGNIFENPELLKNE